MYDDCYSDYDEQWWEDDLAMLNANEADDYRHDLDFMDDDLPDFDEDNFDEEEPDSRDDEWDY